MRDLDPVVISMMSRQYAMTILFIFCAQIYIIRNWNLNRKGRRPW